MSSPREAPTVPSTPRKHLKNSTEPIRKPNPERKAPHDGRKKPIKTSVTKPVARVPSRITGLTQERNQQAADFFNSLLAPPPAAPNGVAASAPPLLLSPMSLANSPRKDLPAGLKESSAGMALSPSNPSRIADVRSVVGKAHLQRLEANNPSLRAIEDYLTKYALRSRLAFTMRGCPFAVSSVIKFSAKASRKKPAINTTETGDKKSSLSEYLRSQPPKNGISYGSMLERVVIMYPTDPPKPYNAHFLDDPNLTTGKHRTVVNFPSYRASLIPFVQRSVLKHDLNDQLKSRLPTLSSSMTLSKIRSLKRHLLDIALDEGFEIATVAIAYVLFEKLVLKNLVKKSTRKLLGASCLCLAAKFHDRKSLERGAIRKLAERTDKELGISPKELFSAEIYVYRDVDFELYPRIAEVMPHFTRLAKELSQDPEYDDFKDFIVEGLKGPELDAIYVGPELSKYVAQSKGT